MIRLIKYDKMSDKKLKKSLKNKSVYLNPSCFRIKADFNDVIINNLSTFKISKVQSNTDEQSVTVELYIPFLMFEGIYDVDGTYLHLFPVFGHGPFK